MYTAHDLCCESETELNQVREFHAERVNHAHNPARPVYPWAPSTIWMARTLDTVRGGRIF